MLIEIYGKPVECRLMLQRRLILVKNWNFRIYVNSSGKEKDTDKFESDIEITDAEIERLKDLSNQWKN